MVSTLSLTQSELDKPSSENKGETLLTRNSKCSTQNQETPLQSKLSRPSVPNQTSTRRPQAKKSSSPFSQTANNPAFFFSVSASEISPSPFPHSGAQSANPVRRVPSRRITSSPSLFPRPCPPGLARPFLHQQIPPLPWHSSSESPLSYPTHLSFPVKFPPFSCLFSNGDIHFKRDAHKCS